MMDSVLDIDDVMTDNRYSSRRHEIMFLLMMPETEQTSIKKEE